MEGVAAGTRWRSPIGPRWRRSRALRGHEPGPGAVLERKEAASRALDLLDSLPTNQQECIRLKFQGGLSYKEISKVTSHSVSYVGVLIHHGMKTLRAQLGAASPGA